MRLEPSLRALNEEQEKVQKYSANHEVYNETCCCYIASTAHTLTFLRVNQHSSLISSSLRRGLPDKHGQHPFISASASTHICTHTPEKITVDYSVEGKN